MTTRSMNSYAIFLLSVTLQNSVDVTNSDPHHLEHYFIKACMLCHSKRSSGYGGQTHFRQPPPLPNLNT